MTDFALPPPSNRRPQSLQQAALWGSRRGETDHYLREFLDTFYLADSAPERTQMLLDEPSLSGNERTDA